MHHALGQQKNDLDVWHSFAVASASMDAGNEAGFEELRALDFQNAFRPIDVFRLKPRRLTNAQAGHRQKPEDTVQRPRFEAVSSDASRSQRDPQGGREQPSYFLIE